MITPPWYNDPVEEIAFNAYAIHTSNLDEISTAIIDKINKTGCTSFSLEGLTDEEFKYIETVVKGHFNV